MAAMQSSVEITKLLQEVFVMGTGRAASPAEIDWLYSLQGDGDWKPLINIVNEYCDWMAKSIGTVKTVQALAKNAFSLALSEAEAKQIATIVESGQMQWADIFALCITSTDALGQILTNRGEAAFDFAQKLAAANKVIYFTGAAHQAVENLLQTIKADTASLNSSKLGLSDLINSLTAKGITSAVVDGYVKGATVFVDSNGDGVLSPGEWSGVTDDTGHYVLPQNVTSGKVIASGGFDILTNKPFSGVLTAPVGSTVVNPITTLVQSLVESGKSATVSEAVAKVQEALNLPQSANPLSFNPMAVLADANASSAAKETALAVQKVALQIANVIAHAANAIDAASESKDLLGGAQAVLSALAEKVAGSSGALSLGDATVLGSVIAQAAEKAQVATVAQVAEQVAKISAAINGKVANAEDITMLAKTAAVAQENAIQTISAGITQGNLEAKVNDFTGENIANLIQQADVGQIAPGVEVPPTTGGGTNAAGGTGTGGGSTGGGSTGGGSTGGDTGTGGGSTGGGSTGGGSTGGDTGTGGGSTGGGSTGGGSTGGDTGTGGGSTGGDTGTGGGSTGGGNNGWVTQFDQIVLGTDSAETLNGSSGRDLIFGLGGDDTISGGGGDDHIDGGAGNDSIDGGEGWDSAGYGIEGLDQRTLSKSLNAAGDTISVSDSNGTLLLTVRLNNDRSITVTGQGDAAALGTDTLRNIEGVGIGNVGIQVGLREQPQWGWIGGSDFSETFRMTELFPTAGDWDHLNLSGGGGNDTLIGRDQQVGEDWFTGDDGDDTIDGGGGIDGYRLWLGEAAAPVLSSVQGNVATIQVGGQDAFRITKNNDGRFTVEGLGNFQSQGTDTLTNIEELIVDAQGQPRLTLRLVETSVTYPWKGYVGGGLFSSTIDASRYYSSTQQYVEVQGDDSDNTIIGSPGRNDISSGRGNDTIDGGNGADIHYAQLDIDAQLALAAGPNNTVRIETVESSPRTVAKIAVVDGTTTITYADGDTDRLTNVESLVFVNTFFDNQGNRVRDQQLQINPITVVDAQENALYAAAGSVNANTFFPNIESWRSTWIIDDSYNSQITGTAAQDRFIWLGGNDTFDGGAGDDLVQCDSLFFKQGIAFATDNGATLVKDGDTSLLTISAPDANGWIRISHEGNTLQVKNTETLTFFPILANGGSRGTYTLNLLTGADPSSHQITVGAGDVDIGQLIGSSTSDYWHITDDSRDANITGTAANETLMWHDGNDTFDGGAGQDSVHMFHSLFFKQGIAFATDNGATLVKDGDTTLLTISALDANGWIRIGYAGDTLQVKNTETLSFFAYPANGGNGRDYTLNLLSAADLSTHQVTVGAGTVDIGQLTGSSPSDYWYIADDFRDANITGTVAHENLWWFGGNDTFDGSDGADSVDLGWTGASNRSEVTDNSFDLLDYNGNVVGHVSKSGSQIIVEVTNYGTLTLIGVEIMTIGGSPVDLTTIFA